MNFKEITDQFDGSGYGTDAFKALSKSAFELMKTGRENAGLYFVIGTAARAFVLRYEDQGLSAEFIDEAKATMHGMNVKVLAALGAKASRFGTKAARLLATAQAAGVKPSVDAVSEDSDRFSRIVTPALKRVDYCILNEIEAGKTTGFQIRQTDGKLDLVALRHAAGAAAPARADLAPPGGSCAGRRGTRAGGRAGGERRTPRLGREPGRSTAGPGGVTLHTVGSNRGVPGVRRYVGVDGGMGDNIRPKLYGARYEVFKASDPEAPEAGKVTIAGKYCESTDILVTDAALPAVESGDILCLPATGAYCLAMASNYNGIPRPAVVMVRDGAARVIRRRETLDDLLLTEVF